MKKMITLALMMFGSFSLFAQAFNQLLDKGDEFYMAGKYEEAIVHFSEAISADPKQSKGYWYRGDAFAKLAKYPQAIEDYTKAIALEPTFWKFYAKRGDCYAYSGQHALAEKDYAKGLEIEPGAASIYLNRADLYAKTNKKDLACADYKKALDLGEKSAKSGAKATGCEWANVAEAPCPAINADASKSEIDPFTGIVFTSKGLSYESFEITTEEGNEYITGRNLAKGESFKLKVLQPSNFCANAENEVFAGTGFRLYDDQGTDLGGQEDIYDSNEGLPAEYLKSLSITLGFTELEANKEYILKIRFFDKRGGGEILVEMPFFLTGKTDRSNKITTNVNGLGAGVKMAAVGADATSFTVTGQDSKPVKDGVLAPNQTYNVNIGGLKYLGAGSTYMIRLLTDGGEVMIHESNSIDVTRGEANILLPVKAISQGNYFLWVKIQDTNGHNIGITMPVTVN